MILCGFRGGGGEELFASQVQSTLGLWAPNNDAIFVWTFSDSQHGPVEAVSETLDLDRIWESESISFIFTDVFSIFF